MKAITQCITLLFLILSFSPLESQSYAPDTVALPSITHALNKEYKSSSTEHFRAIYEIDFTEVKGQKGIPEYLHLDFLINLIKPSGYCITRPNGIENCTHKTYLYGKKLKTDLNQSTPTFKEVTFTYDVYFKNKFLEKKTEKVKHLISDNSIPLSIKLELRNSLMVDEKGKKVYRNMEDVMDDIDIKHFKITYYVFSDETIVYLNKMVTYDYPTYVVEETEKSITEEKEVEIEKQKIEENRLADEKRKSEENKIADETRKSEESKIADEKRKAEKSRIADENRKRIADERNRVTESNKNNEERNIENKPIKNEKSVKDDKALQETSNLENDGAEMESDSRSIGVHSERKPIRFRVGAKVLMPNILGGSAEIVRNRIGLLLDYSSLKPFEKISYVKNLGYRSASNIISKYNYWAVGPNFYFNRRGRNSGGYFGMRYQKVSMETTLQTDPNYRATVSQNGVTMLLGTSTGGLIWFGFEVGGGMFVGKPTGFYVKELGGEKKRAIVEDNDLWGTNKLIPVLNLRLGIKI